jgi:hypothetical protein
MATATRERICRAKGCDRPVYYGGFCRRCAERNRKHGSPHVVGSNALPPGTRRVLRKSGYYRIKAPNHPLAGWGTAPGWVLEQRKVLFDKLGPGSHPCEHCGRRLEWGAKGPRELCVDHVNGVTADNRAENLRAVCRSCNPKHRAPRVCQLLNCGVSLEGERRGKRYCCRSHATMGRAGKTLKVPGACRYCDAELDSPRKKFCSECCRRKAWQERVELGNVAEQPRGLRRARSDGSLHALVDASGPGSAGNVNGDPTHHATQESDLCDCDRCVPVEKGSGWICESTGEPVEAPFEVPA